MGRNADYYQQIRARGICSLCRRPMPDDDPALAHVACRRLQNRRVVREAALRTMTQDEIDATYRRTLQNV